MHVICRCRSQVLGVVRRYYVGVVRRYAPPFSTLRIRSIRRPFQNLSDARTCLPRTPVRASVNARSCICRTPVPVSVHTGVGWKLYYDAYIMQGDLTEFSVDVMVNAANEKLNHSGGSAGIFSRKGCSIVQEEATKYVRRAGKLTVGDAVLLMPAGNLPCKTIVHTFGPRWNAGKVHEAAYLAKGVHNSLVEASKHNYTSIVFQVIRSGIFGVPIDVCAKAMMQGIKDFSAQGHPPQLHSITIMLFQKEHITPFTKASSVALKSFSEQMGRQLAQQPHPSTQKRSSSTGSRRPSRLGVPVAQALELKKGSLTSYPVSVAVEFIMTFYFLLQRF